MKPTDEQQEIIDAFGRRSNLVIEAGAGTGKSSTLRLLGQSNLDRSGLLLAFNRKVAQEARATFPGSMRCATAHSVAFHAIAKGTGYEERLDGPLVTAKDAAEQLGIKRWFRNKARGRKDISTWRIASLAVQTVRRFCYSDDLSISGKHVPFVEGVENMNELRRVVAPFAREVWEDVQNETGFFKFEPDHYLKMWALGDPVLPYDYVCVDEAQDTNKVLQGVIMKQTDCQLIFVGDRHQQLFEWRGASDVMGTFEADEKLFLTQSFRFGDAIAEEANRWLSYLDSELRLRGLSSIKSELRTLEDPRAVLCRTNADVIDQALLAQSLGKSVAIVGGTGEIVRLAEGAQELMTERKTSHPDLAAFASWNDVVTYVEEEKPDGSFSVFVRLLCRYGPEKIIGIAKRCVDERHADRVVTTVHKVKGLEWSSVAIDKGLFSDDVAASDPSPADLMIAYVAVTRAQNELDVGTIEHFHRRREREDRSRGGVIQLSAFQ